MCFLTLKSIIWIINGLFVEVDYPFSVIVHSNPSQEPHKEGEKETDYAVA